MSQDATTDIFTPATSSTRQLCIIGAISLLAIVGLNFQWHTNNRGTATHTEPEHLLPDTVVGHPLLDTFDNTGRKIRQLQGEKLDYFDMDKRSIITDPRGQFEQKSGEKLPTPWQMSAKTATIYQSNNRVDLQGSVQLWSDATRDGRTEILTEQLLIDTSRQFAETNKAVTIRARNSETKAIGLQADLANERLLLPSRVKEIHEVRR